MGNLSLSETLRRETKIANLYKAQMRDKIEIEETVRGSLSPIVDPGLAFPHAPVFIIVLARPSESSTPYPVRTKKLEKWETHFFSSFADCVLQSMLGCPWRSGLTTTYISDVFFSVFICVWGQVASRMSRYPLPGLPARCPVGSRGRKSHAFIDPT